jgi:hypothetical protein
MLVTSLSDCSVLETEYGDVYIRFLHFRGMKPIKIHHQLSETCNDGVMDVKNVRSWVRQFKVTFTVLQFKVTVTYVWLARKVASQNCRRGDRV